MPRAKGSDSLLVGDRAPDFDLIVAGGERRVQRDDFAGSWLLLVFLRHAW